MALHIPTDNELRVAGFCLDHLSKYPVALVDLLALRANPEACEWNVRRWCGERILGEYRLRVVWQVIVREVAERSRVTLPPPVPEPVFDYAAMELDHDDRHDAAERVAEARADRAAS